MVDLVSDAGYKDANIEVYEDYLILNKFYFLKFGQKKICFSDIENFEEVRLIYFNGMARHEHTWLKMRWPFDWKCKHRTEAIFLKLKGKKFGIGIAADEPRELSLLLHKKLDSQRPTQMPVGQLVSQTE